MPLHFVLTYSCSAFYSLHTIIQTSDDLNAKCSLLSCKDNTIIRESTTNELLFCENVSPPYPPKHWLPGARRAKMTMQTITERGAGNRLARARRCKEISPQPRPWRRAVGRGLHGGLAKRAVRGGETGSLAGRNGRHG